MTSPISAGASPTPSPRRRATLFGTSPAVVAVGALVVVIAMGAVACGGPAATTAPTTKPAAAASPTRAASAEGVVFSPPTVSCTSPVDFTTTTRLPATVKAGDTVAERFDGATIESVVMEPAVTLARLADGSWLDVVESSAARMAEVCANGGKNNEGVGVMALGVHDVSFIDASGTVLAQGYYTVAASNASSSAAPSSSAKASSPAAASPNSIVVTPSSFSCSAKVEVAISIDIGSGNGGPVTVKIDGGFYTSVTPPLKESYIYQPGTAAGTLHCQAVGKSGMDSMFAPGQHTVQAYDAKGVLLATASYTVKA